MNNRIPSQSRQIRGHFAGNAYPESSAAILKLLRNALNTAPAPSETAPHLPRILITPHIDFRVNLSAYGTAYQRLAQLDPFPDTFIILGVGHYCSRDFSSVPLDVTTPLGTMQTDLELWNLFEKNCSVEIAHDASSFDREHSIEFPVVWLQALRLLLKIRQTLKMIPIVVGGLYDHILAEEIPSGANPDEFTAFAEAFRQMMGQIDPERTVIIASIDGCHAGPRFDDPYPADEKVTEEVRVWEKRLWELCRTDCFEAFFGHLCSNHNRFSFDGVGVLSLLLQTFQIQAHIDKTYLWYEPKDRSLVSFSAGCLAPMA